MDIESARQLFIDEKEKWIAVRDQWEEEYKRWEDNCEDYGERTLMQKEFDGRDDQLEDRIAAAELARRVSYDTWRLKLLEMQVQESDERTLHESDSLRGVFALTLESRLSMLHKQHSNTLANSDLRSQSLASLESTKKSLEDRLAVARSTTAYWEKEQTRLDLSPNRSVLSPLPNNKSDSIPEKGLNREEERNRWAAQRKKLRDRLRAKQSKKTISQSVEFSIEFSGKKEQTFVGDTVPKVIIQGKGLQDAPIFMYAMYPFAIFSQSGACAAAQYCNDQCIIDEGTLFIGLQDGAHLNNIHPCIIKVVYPAVDQRQPIVAEVSLNVTFEPCYSPARKRHTQDFVTTTNVSYTATSAHFASEAARQLAVTVDQSQVVGVSFCRESSLLAVAFEREIRLFELTNNVFNCTMTLQVGEEIKGITLSHLEYVMVSTKSATLVWERKLIHTWEQYTTSLPATTARFRVGCTDIIYCVGGCILFINENGRSLRHWDPSTNADMKHPLREITPDVDLLPEPDTTRCQVISVCQISQEEVVVTTTMISYLVMWVEGDFSFQEIYRNDVNHITAAAVAATTSERSADGFLAAFATADGLVRLSSSLKKPMRVFDGEVSFLAVEPVANLLYASNERELYLFSIVAKCVINVLPVDISLSWKNCSLISSFPVHSDTGTCTEIIFCCSGATLRYRCEERPIVTQEATCSLPETLVCCQKDWRPPKEKPQPQAAAELSFAAPVPRSFINEKVNEIVQQNDITTFGGAVPPKELVKSVSQSTPYLGLRVKDGGKLKPGALCMSTNINSPTSQAGIEPGDTIVAVGGLEITSANDFKSALRNYSVGDTVQFHFVDKGNTTRVTSVTFSQKLETDFGIADSIDGGSTCPEYGQQSGRKHHFSKKSRMRSRSPSIMSYAVDEVSRSRSPSVCSQNSFLTTSSYSVDPQFVSWTASEQRNLSTSNFSNTTPLNRFHGFLKANGAVIPTPANEATLRKSVVKFLTKLKLSRKRQTYIDWWKLSRPPTNAPIVTVE
eukprot:TRINITY_DN16171_c0_g1_i1.p1 TRINITY_DN16171_c0_g1~~TRINITY_DN16171_c0_g1_i1.p1  ORF type:complete len:1016 (+),score=202.89 TRINITY_DN16171_c0_g1_i1:708-3755(+)